MSEQLSQEEVKALLEKQQTRSKYHNVPQVVDGIWFPSKREARRYGELKLLQSQGLIANLKLQVSYKLVVNGYPVTTYRADFVYTEAGHVVVEDAKGKRTDLYKVKRNLFKALGVEIRES